MVFSAISGYLEKMKYGQTCRRIVSLIGVQYETEEKQT